MKVVEILNGEKKMKVLVIRPNTFCNAEKVKELEKIKPNEGGVVLVPSYCDYEFGEIDEIKIEGRKEK